MSDEIYEKLAAPFDSTFKDVRGGVELEYVTGEQVISRLNQVLGVNGWSFEVKEHGYHQEADEFWVLGQITAWIGPDGSEPLVREQFGSQKIKRSRATDTPLDIGFDLKGAATDCLKKCASLLGVGLYLSAKEPQGQGQPARAGENGPAGGLVCAQCDAELKEVKFRDGTSWTPIQLAQYGQRKHGQRFCWTHYLQANKARKAAEQASSPVAAASQADVPPWERP